MKLIQAAGFFVALSALAPAQQKHVYIANDDHTDYWWSETPDTYRDAFLTSLDYYLDQIDATASHPTEFQGRWNCDGWLWLWTYEQFRTPAEFQRLIDRIADGHISVPLNALCINPGGAPMEALLRGMYYPGRIEREFGIGFPLAYTMENQTQPLGLWSLFAGSGVKYSWKGICQCATSIPSAWDREHDIYWGEGLDGQRVLVKWNSKLWNNRSMGGYAEARDPAEVIDRVTTYAPSNGFQARYPWGVIGCFGKGWDDLLTLTDEFITIAMAKTDSTRQIYVSNEIDFFEHFEASYGDQIPSHTASFGNEWNLSCASLAETSARVKRSVEKLRATEAIAALVSLYRPEILQGKDAEREAAWRALGLYWEHDFGMGGYSPTHPWVIGRIAWQNGLADDLEAYVDALFDDAGGALGELLPAGTDPRFAIFNPLAHDRTEHVDLPVSGGPFHVVDLFSDRELPSQVLPSGDLRVQVSAVPSLGYRVIEVRDGAGMGFPDAATVSGGPPAMVLENDRVRVEVAERGAILSLIDKDHGGREFVQPIGGLYANDLGPSSGTISLESLGPASATLLAQGPSPVAHATRVTLFLDSARVDVANEITENFDTVETWTYALDLDTPTYRHEELGAILTARLLADGGHYSPRQARYDWMIVNHFGDLSGSDGAGITLANADCYFAKLGNSSTSSLDAATPKLAVLAGGNKIAASKMGLPAQGGADHFTQRFAMRAHDGYDSAEAMRFGLELSNPLVAVPLMPPPPRAGFYPPLPQDPTALARIDDPNVLLWSLKPAEDGPEAGWVVRLWNVSDQKRTATLALPLFEIEEAYEITHIETDVAPLLVTGGVLRETYEPQQLRSFRLVLHEDSPLPDK